MRDRVLVTGGAGFIGRRVVALLRAAGRAVTILDDGSAGLPLPIEAADLRIIAGDIRDPAALDAAFFAEPVQAVVHLAALHHIPTCQGDPLRTLAINVLGTQSLLLAAARAGVARMVLASSAAVYAPAVAPHHETAATDPIDIYGLSKLTNEGQLALWVRQCGAQGRIARIFNAIGPGDPNGHVIPDILQRLANGTGVLRLGNLETMRDYVDVGDLAAGLVGLLDDCDPAALATVNLCRGRGTSVAELARNLAAVLGQAVEIVSDPALRRAQDRPHLVGDPTLAATRFGWRAQTPLAQTLAVIGAGQ